MNTVSPRPDRAMVLAAGRGTRFLHITSNQPKAMVKVAGKSLIDHQLDRLQTAGIDRAIVNVHHFADTLETHLRCRNNGPEVQISDERDCLLETGGALVRARHLLGKQPFFVMNADAIWDEIGTDPLMALAERMAKLEKPAIILLLARKDRSLGLHTKGDFALMPDQQLRRPQPGEEVPYYYAGSQLMHPAFLVGENERPFSANLLWDKAAKAGALYGVILDGFWLHVGDPQALEEANLRLERGPV